MKGQKSQLERFRILSTLLCSILKTSNSIGVYQGNQCLLIPKEQYLTYIDELKVERSPVILWIYIGLRESKTGNSAYTYGLSTFKKYELEIVNSKLELEELHSFLLNISAYVIENNITFNVGETIGYSNDQKIKITLSKGEFVEGQSIKIDI